MDYNNLLNNQLDWSTTVSLESRLGYVAFSLISSEVVKMLNILTIR